MFRSALLKLTGWYLLILMGISLLFSSTIYNVASYEIQGRLSDLQTKLKDLGIGEFAVPGTDVLTTFEQDQFQAAKQNLLLVLFYVNLLILVGGGTLCLILARRTLEKIKRSHDAQARFTSDASHELRTPLAVMKTELEVALADPNPEPAEMREILESNLEEVNRLTYLTETLLQFARLNHTNLKFESTNVNELVDQIAEKYDKGLKRIQLHLPKKPVFATINAPSIEQLITILIDNALKYSPDKSKIGLKLETSGKNVRIKFTNTGQGIPKDQLSHVFTRFYRTDKSRNTKGTGLGLALAKEIVGIHRGDISVTSTPGKNTTFTVLLPLRNRK